MNKMSVDVSDIECEEAIMVIRMTIRKNNFGYGDSFNVTANSEPFWSLLQKFGQNTNARIERWGNTNGKTWTATITL